MKNLIYGLAVLVGMGIWAGPTNIDSVAGAQDKARDERRGPPSMKEMRERMEKMAKEEPEKFAQITNRMARWRQRRIDRANEKLAFLKSFDMSGMTAEQRQTHEKYQNLIERREQLEEKMHNPDMTDEDRTGIMREMRETDHAMRQAARQEREILVRKELKSLGLPDEKLTNTYRTIERVIDVTASNSSILPPSTGSR